MVEGAEFTVTKRNLFASLADELSGRIGFEADAVTYAAYQALEAGGLELVPRRGVVEALRAVKDDEELATIRRAGEITSEAFERLAQEPFVGQNGEGGGVAARLALPRARSRRRPPSPRSSPPARTARRRTRTPAIARFPPAPRS